MYSWISLLRALPRRGTHLRDRDYLGVLKAREVSHDVGSPIAVANHTKIHVGHQGKIFREFGSVLQKETGPRYRIRDAVSTEYAKAERSFALWATAPVFYFMLRLRAFCECTGYWLARWWP